MLGLPKSTEVKHQLPKSRIFTTLQFSNAEQELFNADISRMDIVHEISSATLAVEETETVHSIFVVQVLLKKLDYNPTNIVRLSKLIDQNMVFLLRLEGKACLAVYLTKLLTSPFQPINELQLNLNGLNLEQIWQNIVLQIGNIQLVKNRTIEEQIHINDEMRRLERQIETLTAKVWNEKQPHKKYQMNIELQKLRAELQSLLEA